MISRLSKNLLIKILTRFTVFIILCSSVVPSCVSAIPLVSSDFDGDGFSDFALITINQDRSLSWKSFSPGSATSQSRGRFGLLGDHIAVAPWLTPGVPTLGVVRETPQGVEWIIEVPGGTQSIFLGQKTDTVFAGADLNGNGIADAIALAKEGRALRWKIRLDPFSATPGTELSFLFGRAKDIPFFFNPKGKSDVLALLRNGTQRATLLYRSLDRKQKGRRAFGRIIPGVERPFPVKGKQKKDLIGLSAKRGEGVRIKLVDENGRRRGLTDFAQSGTLVVGDYLANPGEELALVKGQQGLFEVANSRVALRSTVAAGQGIPVDEININTFDAPPPVPPTVTPVTPPTAVRCPAISNPGGKCQQENPNDGNEGFLWKPVSDTQRFAVTLLPSDYTGCTEKVETVAPLGGVVKELTKKAGTPNGGREGFQDYSLTGNDYQRSYGGVIIRATMKTGTCIEYFVSNATRRTD